MKKGRQVLFILVCNFSRVFLSSLLKLHSIKTYIGWAQAQVVAQREICTMAEGFESIEGLEHVEKFVPQKAANDSEEEEMEDFVGFALSQIAPKADVPAGIREIMTKYYQDSRARRVREKQIFEGMRQVYASLEGTQGEMLGYRFDEQGKLLHQVTGQAFQFIDQVHYDLLALAVTEHVQRLVVGEHGLQKLEVPFLRHHPGGGHGWSFLFATPDALTNDRLVVLLVGSGKIQAGLWAQSLCINDNIDSGSVIPYLRDIKEKGWAAVVLNPNVHEGVPIADSPEAHVDYVWEHMIKISQARKVALVAHSYGGVSLMSLFKTQNATEVLHQLKAVAFTDSVHHVNGRFNKVPAAVKRFLRDHAIDWVTSGEPLGTVVHDFNENKGCKCLSAGTTSHPATNEAARPAVIDFFEMKFGELDQEEAAAAGVSI